MYNLSEHAYVHFFLGFLFLAWVRLLVVMSPGIGRAATFSAQGCIYSSQPAIIGGGNVGSAKVPTSALALGPGSFLFNHSGGFCISAFCAIYKVDMPVIQVAYITGHDRFFAYIQAIKNFPVFFHFI
jgi:hypothetical protein